MVGRKRKAGKRKPSGDLILERTPTSPEAIARKRELIASQMPHRAMLPAGKQVDTRAESAFGRMSIIGLVDATQYAAGIEYRRRVSRYRAVIECPNPNPGAISLDGRMGGVARFFSDDDARKRRDDHQRAFEALNCSGRKALDAVNVAVIKDQMIAGDRLKYLRTGLDALAEYLGLTETRKSASGGK